MAEFHTPIKQCSKPDDKEKIIIPASPFLHRLGYGTGVNVMQLVRSPKAGQFRSPWALKMLNKQVKQHKVYSERLKSEAELLQRMSHPNIVGFRAFSKSKTLFLGMEACDVSLGDLIEQRAESGGEPYTPLQILKVAVDIGNALDYIHTKIQILHGDMKSFNVLVNGDFAVCKLCDFGVALPLDQNGTLDKEQGEGTVYYGTEAWSAPEVIHGGDITTKTDIFPFGITLWEMIALSPPHVNLEDTLDESLDHSVAMSDESFGDMPPFSEKYGTRPPIPGCISEEQYSSVLALHHACTEPAPRDRPTAAHAAAVARDMLIHIQGKQTDR